MLFPTNLNLDLQLLKPFLYDYVLSLEIWSYNISLWCLLISHGIKLIKK